MAMTPEQEYQLQILQLQRQLRVDKVKYLSLLLDEFVEKLELLPIEIKAFDKAITKLKEGSE